MGKTVRLRNRLVLFCDPETGFEISGDEEVLFPPKVGSLTRAWLQGGGLLVREKLEEEEAAEESIVAVPNPTRIYSELEISEMPYEDLMNLIRDLGLRTLKNSRKREHLTEALIEYQNGLRAVS